MGLWTGSSLVQTMACHLLSTNPGALYGPVNWVLLGSDNGLSLAQHKSWCSIWACELGPPWFRQWPVTCSAPILVMYMGLWTGSSLVQTMACHLLSTNTGDVYGPVNWVLLGSDNGLSLAQHQYWCSIWACELGPPWFRQWPVTCSAPILVI